MSVINVHEAKTNFSKLIDRALSGEKIIVARAGKPVVTLVPTSIVPKGRKVVGGGFRLQEKLGEPLTPELLNEIASHKFD